MLVLRPQLIEVRIKELISKYLAAFWVVVMLSFLGLQIQSDLAIGHDKAAKDTTAQEYFLATASTAPAPNLAPDLKMLQPWFVQQTTVLAPIAEQATAPGFQFHSLLKVALIRLLEATISINAP